VVRHPQSKYSKELSSYLDKLSENNNWKVNYEL
jgi:hypothetical protein